MTQGSVLVSYLHTYQHPLLSMASYKNYSVGDRIWIPHEEDAWLAGRVEKVSQHMLETVTERGTSLVCKQQT